MVKIPEKLNICFKVYRMEVAMNGAIHIAKIKLIKTDKFKQAN